jgi:hypothetical protein
MEYICYSCRKPTNVSNSVDMLRARCTQCGGYVADLHGHVTFTSYMKRKDTR